LLVLIESEIRKLLTPPDVEYIGEISDGEKSRGRLTRAETR